MQLMDPDGSWGRGFYRPKWTSSNYTLVDLKTLGMVPDHPKVRKSIHKITLEEKSPDGGINPSGTISQSDVCISGMFLDCA